MNNKRKIIAILIFLFISFYLKIEVIANEQELDVNYTDDFSNWLELTEEERQQTNIPSINSINVPDKYFEENIKKENIWGFLKRLIGLEKKVESKYILSQDIEVNVKNQGQTSACWAFSILSSMETNMALRKNEYKDFSERHMMYATSRNFLDGINKNGFNKQAREYGLHEIGLAYLTNGQGAVLEKDMPFIQDTKNIYLKEIEKTRDTYVSEYEKLPSIFKNIGKNGNISYHNGMGFTYTEEQVKAIRNHIKDSIKKYGGISAVTMSSGVDYYNNSNPLKASAYFCNKNEAIRDHGFTIIGWDDNYKKENFNEKNRPTSDGAYIVLNSYGEETFEKGIIYVSYEDVLIETSLYIIKDTTNEEYDNLYQNDFFGGAAYIGSEQISSGYYASIYERKIDKIEELDYVGVTVLDYVKLNIYVNPNSEKLDKSNLTKVGSTDVLNPGYYKIKIDPIKLTSDKFSIVIEQISENNRFYLTIEPNISSTPYDKVTAEEGNSKISLDGIIWEDLSSLEVDENVLNIKESDVCIKAFTKEVEEEKYFKSEKYNIDEKYIKNVELGTTAKEFFNNILTNQEIKIFNENEIVLENEQLKTGMELKVGDKIFKIVVVGDINADGKLSLIDISKLIYHYNEDEKYLLKDEFKQAGDINSDGKISIIDISKLIILYNQI